MLVGFLTVKFFFGNKILKIHPVMCIGGKKNCVMPVTPVIVHAVPPLFEEGRQQASDHAAETEEIQEPNYPGLQDSGSGPYQHGRGIPLTFSFKSNSVYKFFLLFFELHQDLALLSLEN